MYVYVAVVVIFFLRHTSAAVVVCVMLVSRQILLCNDYSYCLIFILLFILLFICFYLLFICYYACIARFYLETPIVFLCLYIAEFYDTVVIILPVVLLS